MADKAWPASAALSSASAQPAPAAALRMSTRAALGLCPASLLMTSQTPASTAGLQLPAGLLTRSLLHGGAGQRPFFTICSPGARAWAVGPCTITIVLPPGTPGCAEGMPTPEPSPYSTTATDVDIVPGVPANHRRQRPLPGPS